MTVLSVNLNKVALLRNARGHEVPSVLRAADICVAAGARGITVHPRPDQRHVRPDDVFALAEHLDVEFNIEGNPFEGPTGDYPGFLELVSQVRPTQCTLVPDAVEQLTSDHGWDLAADGERLAPLVEELTDLGVRVSLFMDPDSANMAAARTIGADRIELYTEGYARAHESGAAARALTAYRATAEAAQAVGLGVNAGHDLNLDNLREFREGVPGLLEVSIGHALVADALEMGLEQAVKRYLACLKPH